MDKHDTVGIDCVAMCVNDIVSSGTPCFDSVAMGVSPKERKKLSRQRGLPPGGLPYRRETAEMPGFIPKTARYGGFSVGLVDYKDAIDPPSPRVTCS